MSAVDMTKDLQNATVVVTSVFAASPERVWRLWADPRQLERWWGPDPYPATVVDHDLLEPGAVQAARRVLRGPGRSDAPREPDRSSLQWDRP